MCQRNPLPSHDVAIPESEATTSRLLSVCKVISMFRAEQSHRDADDSSSDSPNTSWPLATDYESDPLRNWRALFPLMQECKVNSLMTAACRSYVFLP